MNNELEKIERLNDLTTELFRRKHIVVLNPEIKVEKEEENSNIIYDEIEWKIPEKIRPYLNELKNNRKISNEDKILQIYEKLCQEYIYDDNLLSYIQKIDDDSYALPDWYGRSVDQEWEKNRETHNRRVCYEVSRYLAKSLAELFENNKDMNICILWDKSLTHYFVGLTCNEYSLTLDLDNFNNIKDMTRIKTGLTAEGIEILEDKNGKFKKTLDYYNKDRCKSSVQKIEDQIAENKTSKDEDSDITSKQKNLEFLKNAVEILKNDHNIDSQGLYEYIKEIVDVTLGPESRKKVWKEVKEQDDEQSRYIRCLILEIDGKKYIIDVGEMQIREFEEEELKGEDRTFIPYKDLLSDELINFRSRKEERYKGR